MEQIYYERNACVAAIARCAQGLGYGVGWRDDTPDGPAWPCVYVDLPTGQVSWHISRALFEGLGLDRLPRYPGVWDGHDTDEKYRRLGAWRPQCPGQDSSLLAWGAAGAPSSYRDRP